MKGVAWFSHFDRAGRAGNKDAQAPDPNPEELAKMRKNECACGAPGKYLCVCDESFDKLCHQMDSYEKQRARPRR